MWSAQDAFLKGVDPATGKQWADRHGIAYGKGLRVTGNVEQYLNYKKRIRTGRSLKGMKVKRSVQGASTLITLFNDVPYIEDHETGRTSAKHTIKDPYVKSGAQGVITGGSIVARPSMNPSIAILGTPKRLLQQRFKFYGWKT